MLAITLWMTLAGGILPTSAQESAPAASAVLSVAGEIAKARAWTLSDLAALPRVEVTATEKDGTVSTFQGVALAEILKACGTPFGELLKGPALGLAVSVIGADGYKAIFSLAEIDPAMNARQIVLADHLNGAEIPAAAGPLRLVIPEEKRRARWVRQVIRLEIVRVPAAAEVK